MTRDIKNRNVLSVAIAMCFLLTPFPLLAVYERPIQGETLPAFTLAVPQDTEARRYLGLSASGHFTVSDIRARVVILYIFSMYCPVCQRQAPSTSLVRYCLNLPSNTARA